MSETSKTRIDSRKPDHRLETIVRTEQIEPRTETVCLICETEKAPEALMCGECFAPMALTWQAEARGRDPRIVSVIGDSNVGKTV